MEFLRGLETCPEHDIVGEYVARGNDSRVIRVAGKIHKIYDQDHLRFMVGKENVASHVSLYMGIQNAASMLAEAEKWEMSLPNLKKHHPMRVLKFDEGHLCNDCGVVTGVQAEITGPNLEDDPRFPDKESLQKTLEVTSEWIAMRIRVSGIYLSVNNIKFQNDIMMITDLASVVGAVKLQ